MALLQPKKSKYRKQQKGRIKGVAQRGNQLAFGSFGLKSLDAKWVSAAQLEAARKVIRRTFKKTGKLWIRVFPDKPVTSKPSETPMGGGKGSIDRYVVPVKPGKILFEVEGVSEDLARQAFKQVSYKLPIKTKFVKRQEI